MLAGIDDLLGPADAEKAQNEICDEIGITDDQVVHGNLNWESTEHVFLEAVSTAYYARKERMKVAMPRIMLYHSFEMRFTTP